jgi:hypothetical protein
MSIDLPNLQGASLRQMVATGDQAAQMHQVRRDSAETQAKFGQVLVEKAVRSRDQTDSNEMVVKRQEDSAEFQSGDALAGGGGGGGHSGDSRSGHDGDSYVDESDSHLGLEMLADPFEVADRFRAGLLAGGREAGERAFRTLDRKALAGLVDRVEPS